MGDASSGFGQFPEQRSLTGSLYLDGSVPSFWLLFVYTVFGRHALHVESRHTGATPAQ